MSDTNINQDTTSDALDKNGSFPSANMIMKLGKQIEENIRKDYFEDYREDDTIDKIRDSLRNIFNKLKNSAVFINSGVQTNDVNRDNIIQGHAPVIVIQGHQGHQAQGQAPAPIFYSQVIQGHQAQAQPQNPQNPPNPPNPQLSLIHI